MKAVKRITRIISEEIELPIGAQGGNLLISQAKTIFRSWIDSDFKKFGLDMPSRPTEKINTVVHEIIGDGTFLQIFKDINPDLDKSILTMSQIIEFCRQHSSWLRQEGFGALFLIKKESFFNRVWSRIVKSFFGKEVIKNYFVVRVIVRSDGLSAYVRRLKYNYIWAGEYRYRVVVPQLIS